MKFKKFVMDKDSDDRVNTWLEEEKPVVKFALSGTNHWKDYPSMYVFYEDTSNVD